MREASRFLAGGRTVVCLSFDGGDLVYASLVATTGENRRKPGVNNFEGLIYWSYARSKRKDVRVVVLAAHLRFMFSADSGSANSGHLVGCHGHADSASAHQNTQIGAALMDVVGDKAGKIGVVS